MQAEIHTLIHTPCLVEPFIEYCVFFFFLCFKVISLLIMYKYEGHINNEQ